MGAEAMAEEGGWGTWEELILGGAVLRHGTKDWNVVALEVRTRTLCPYTFTPQACKARYEDLKKRYSGSKAWFEELKKRRVAQLKQELAKSEDSIGSLESKIKSLEGEKQHSNQVDYGSSETESPLPALDSEATESFVRETSNDQNSAGSFTKDTSTRGNWLCEPQNIQTVGPTTSVSDKDSSIKNLGDANYGHGVIMKKRRGQRKRKDCNNNYNNSNRAIIERSVCESDNNLGSSSNVVSTPQKETSTNDNCGPIVRESYKDSCTIKREDSLIEIFKSVAQSEPAAVFRHRMDSQKRARYRRVIKQHMDIGTIKSRIVGQSIKSAKELFRDLLLLANNALVFYSRRTREYKSALSLRNIVMREYKLYCTGYYCHEATSAFIPCNPPVKPRTVRPRPCKDKALEKIKDDENALVAANEEGLRKQCDVDHSKVLNHDSLLKGKKGIKRPMKVKPELDNRPSKATSVKPRKRVRR
ncbi:hypothetical protein ABFS82_08G143100 [Erythranthe guttata]|nr:PREDICTED: uncharacterized protein LOC105951610 [Erythranthe guttata]|eukprot:XP_012830514.1 PREDICTED: uncharacterized protein LOC105951610 [Erythranthe guttata]